MVLQFSAITKDQAEWISRNYYNTVITSDYPTQLVIYDKKPVWMMMIRGALVGIDAKTGETVYFAGTHGGSDISQIQTRFDPTQYFIQTQLLWIISSIFIVLIGGFLYYKKPLFVHKRK